jgi:hypothetical protein
MQTECRSGQFEFEGFDGRRVVAAFDGGVVTSDAGTVLLREADRAIGLIERVAACFTDHREADEVIHALPTLIGQRIVAIALGYEDVNDHDTLRRDPVLALFSDQLEPKRKNCAPSAGNAHGIDGKALYEKVYCARGEMENRIKECQLDLAACPRAGLVG